LLCDLQEENVEEDGQEDISQTSEPNLLEIVPEVPKRALEIFARLWQLETWLRRMVYVELRALKGDDWAQELPPLSKSFGADKALRHMPTPEMNVLSYSTLTKLMEAIGKHWTCFECYFPPKDILDAKLKEVFQIRNRVAHFRLGHSDDLPRLLQFLRDVDLGFWNFCTSYNDARPILPQSRDKVTDHLLPMDPLPWGEIRPHEWAQVGFVDKSLVIGVTVNVQRRPWVKWSHVDGEPGFLYDVRLHAQDGRQFNYKRLLEDTKAVHPHIVHILLDTFGNFVRLTIPAKVGSQKVIELVERFVEVGRYNVSRQIAPSARSAEKIATEWPEYVVGPKNPLSFLDPDMPCSFFNV
jgi:hypothetical protein